MVPLLDLEGGSLEKTAMTEFIVLVSMLLITHFVGDYLLQNREVAENKHKDIYYLIEHVVFYTIILCMASVTIYYSPLLPGVGVLMLVWWAVFNGILHFFVDGFTSRLTHQFYVEKKYKLFWITVGSDQLAHYLIMMYSLYLFFG